MNTQEKYYEDLESEANDTLKDLYPDNEQDKEVEDTDQENTENEEQEDRQELEKSTPDEEPTVPESRYKESVRAMNASQQEAAQLRKELKELQERESVNPVEEENDSTDEESEPDFDTIIDELPAIVKENKALKKRLDKMEAEFDSVKATTNKVQQREAEDYNRVYWDQIKEAHDDADELPKDSAYGEWYHSQPESIQKMAASENANEVIRALDLFRMDVPKIKPKNIHFSGSTASRLSKLDAAMDILHHPEVNTSRQSKLDAARNADTPTVKGVTKSPNTTKRTFTNEQIAKMSPAEYAKNEAAIDEALMRGEIQ